MFEKKTVIFKKRDRETWQQIKAALKEAGLRGVRAGHYLQETVMGGGCGACFRSAARFSGGYATGRRIRMLGRECRLSDLVCWVHVRTNYIADI